MRAHTQTHRQTCWHAHLSLGKPPQAVALAQRHSLSWVKTLGAEKHPVKMLSISDARTDKRRRWFEEKWCWSKSNTEDASGRDALLVSSFYVNLKREKEKQRNQSSNYCKLAPQLYFWKTWLFLNSFCLWKCRPETLAAFQIKSPKERRQCRANETPCA